MAYTIPLPVPGLRSASQRLGATGKRKNKNQKGQYTADLFRDRLIQLLLTLLPLVETLPEAA